MDRLHTTARRLRSLNTHNLQTLRRQPLAEISGSLGDLGTLLPLLIALTLTKSISLSSTLVFTGLANILTGLTFGIPLPVQPMKAIAAVAMANKFSREETAAAGLFVAAAVGSFAATGLLEWFTRIIPVPVVKGIQVGAGLSLVLSAGSSLLGKLHWTGPTWEDNYIWAVAAFLFLLVTSKVPRIPYALLIFLLGLFLAGFQLRSSHSDHHSSSSGFNLWHPSLGAPSPKTFLDATLSAGLGQLPLTTLNSIIAVCHLSADLLPSIPAPSVTAMGVSVSLMNLIGCWFGAMPACHGSGGLAGQYRFGARSGSSVIILGLVKLFFGLFVGEGLVDILSHFPKSLLGIMVVAAGVELAKVGESLNVGARDLWEESEPQPGLYATNGPVSPRKRQRELSEQERKDRWAVMLVTVAGLLAFRNDAIGFIAGMLWHWGIIEAPKAFSRWNGGTRARSLFGRMGPNRSSRTQEHEDEDEEAQRLLDGNFEAPEGRLI